MSGRSLVGVDPTVSAVRASAGLGRLVDDDGADDEVVGGQVIGFGVGLGVLEERDEDLGRLDGPATCSYKRGESARIPHFLVWPQFRLPQPLPPPYPRCRPRRRSFRVEEAATDPATFRKPWPGWSGRRRR